MYIKHTACVFHTHPKYFHILPYVDMYGCSVCYVFGMVVWVPVSLAEVSTKLKLLPKFNPIRPTGTNSGRHTVDSTQNDDGGNDKF